MTLQQGSLMSRQTGSSLLEVLIAVVILAFGLLGLAGLQATSVKSSHSAYQRSQATLLAYDMVDRMRAARTAAIAGRFDDGSAHADRATWNAALVRTLGVGATGSVVRAANNRVTVTIRWDDNRGRIRTSSTADATGASSATDDVSDFVYQTEF
jgi:type IV pilus assembly protein PilV